MARRKARIPQGKKLQPVPLTLTFDLGVLDPSPGGGFSTATTKYIDLSQCASLVSRKFFRQGLVWAVSGMKLISNSEDSDGNPQTSGALGRVHIRKLPRTWIMSNAWHKGFASWQEMNRDALDSSPSVKPKFLDFKIFADDYHHATGVSANLLPINFASSGSAVQTVTPGEWEMSKYVIPKTDGTDGVHNREIIATGSNYPPAGASGLGAVSLIEGYAASRGLPDIRDPNVPADAADAEGNAPENWMSALENDGTQQDDQILTDMVFENNQAPYPFENDGTHTDTMYPGGENQLPGLEISSIEQITTSTVGGNTMFGPETFPCGLIRIDVVNYDQTNHMANKLQIKLVPGNHRGYMCQPMQEM